MEQARLDKKKKRQEKPKEEEAAGQASPELVWIPVDLIDEPFIKARSNPEVDPSFVASVAKGQESPIKVRQSRKKKGRYELIYGNRRLVAAIEGKVEKLLAIIVDSDDKGVARMILRENGQRKDPNPMDTAAIVLQCTEELGMSQREVVVEKGGSEQSLSNLLRVYRDEVLREKVGARELDLSKAIYLLRNRNDKEKESGATMSERAWRSFVDKSTSATLAGIRSQKKQSPNRKCFDCSNTFPESSMKVARLCTECHAKRKTANQA